MAARSIEGHVLEQVLDTEKFKAFYLRPPSGGRMMSTLFVFTPEGIVIMGDLCPGNRGGNGTVSVFGYSLGWFVEKLGGSYLCEKFLRKGWHAELAKEWCLDAAKEVLRGRMDDEEGFGADGLSVVADDREAAHDELVSLRKDLKDAIARADAADIDQLRKEIALAKVRLSESREQLARQREGVAAKLARIADDVDSCVDLEWFRKEIEEEFPDMDLGEYCPGYGYDPSEKMWLCALQEKFAELYNARTPASAQ